MDTDLARQAAEILYQHRQAGTLLVNELSAQNITLNEGEFVTTGTTTLPMTIQPGCLVSADFGRLGRIHCQLGRN